MDSEFEQRLHQQCPSVLSLWLDLETSFPNAPFEPFVPDNPGTPEDILEAQLTKARHSYITASIHLRQAQLAYGQCLAKLARRKAAKKRQINSFSVIFRLPNEILSDIFQFTGQPILTSHICHRWRSIAIDTPSLWCYIERDIGLSQANTFLKRSRNRPLTMCHTRIPDMPIHRIKMLDLQLDRPRDIRKFYYGPATLLESMNIEAVGGSAWDGSVNQLFNQSLFANQAPRLREVRLNRCVLIKFPTQSVTKLVLAFCLLPEARTTISFLQSIPALRCLVLFHARFNGYWFEMLDCQLSSLQRLSVSFLSITNIKIIAPKLEDLALSAAPCEVYYPRVSPGSSLRHLWLNAEQFLEYGAWPINGLLLDVQVLQIGEGRDNALRDILSVLSKKDNNKNFLLPSLLKLFIHNGGGSPSELASLQRLILERQVTVACIHPAQKVAYMTPDFNELCCTPLDPVIEQTYLASSDDSSSSSDEGDEGEQED